jgi:hypothetical protein
VTDIAIGLGGLWNPIQNLTPLLRFSKNLKLIKNNDNALPKTNHLLAHPN